MPRWVLATSNQGKAAEFRQRLSKNVELLLVSDFNTVPVEETGLTFVENALLKARAASQASGLPALADDSGLMVDALAGAPGVISARYAGDHAQDQDNLKLLLHNLRNTEDKQRQARFVCVLAWVSRYDDPCPLFWQASWEGIILREPVGHQGFGYDPIFYVPDHHCSAAQLEPHVKNQISHRGQAISALCQHWDLL